MKTVYKICAIIYLVTIVSGCGGGVRIQGIAEREINRPKLPRQVKIDPHAFNFFINGTIFEAMGEIYMAKDQYGRALELVPTSNLVRYSYALMLAKLKEYRKSLNEADPISPKNIDDWLLIGNNYRSLAIFDSSLMAYNKALEIDSNIVSVYYFMGAFYQQGNSLDSAIWAYRHIARLVPNYNSFQQLANFQLKAGKMEDAKTSFYQSLALDSTAKNVRSYLALSAIYEETGDRDKAKEMTEAAERLEPNDLMIQKRLLRFYEENGQFDKGIETSQKIMQLDPEDKLIDRRLGILYYRADSLRLADSLFAALIDAGDDNLTNYYYAGQVSFAQKNYEASKIHFGWLTSVADTVLDGWMNLARVYYIQDSVDMAIITYETGLKHMQNIEDSMIIVYSMAAANESKDRVDRAIEQFELVLKNMPRNSLALNYLGYMLADRGMRLDYAHQLILKALEIEPENGAYIDSYGWVLYRMGDYRKALQVLLQALQFIESDPVIFEHVGDAYQALGDFKMAREYWGKAYKLNPDNNSIRGKLYQ